MFNDRFISYFRDTFFVDAPGEMQKFLDSLEKPILRTIRIRPDRVDAVRIRLEQDGWICIPTYIPQVYAMDRRADFSPLERRLGYTLDHLLGNFYIQELAAATSVHILSGGTVHTDDYLILDMAASPGGKTTQLTEMYPRSTIIANEPTRERIPQLLDNLDRMGSAGVCMTLYMGQYFRKYPEIFDRILLDAPCSGEGTMYKGTDAAKHWHIKNIKQIAHLQSRLFQSALHSLKVGGEMVYSTCSMNMLENEDVLSICTTRYVGCFEIIYQKKFWPHIDGTGGFFVAKIKKLKTIVSTDIDADDDVHIGENSPMIRGVGGLKNKQKKGPDTNDQIRPYSGKDIPVHTDISLYTYADQTLAIRENIHSEYIRKNLYTMRYGECICKNGIYEPMAWRYIDTTGMRVYTILDEKELDTYLRGGIVSIQDIPDGVVLLQYLGQSISLEYVDAGMLSNRWKAGWRRK